MYYFEPKRKVDNRIWATKNARRPSIAKRKKTVKKVLYAIFFTNKGPAIGIPVPKGRTVTGKFYKNVVLRKLKNYYKSCRPKTGLKYVRLLHDNTPAHKAQIVTDFLASERLPSFRTLRIRQTWPPATIFSFQNLNIIYLEDTIREMPLDLLFISV